MSAPHEFKIGDVVLAKIKGFPSWPGIIMDDENVPRAVLEERPSGKSSLHTIRFFPAADYHWASARDLKLLTNEDIDTFLEGSTRKSGDLLKAYKLAKDPHKWNAEQNRIVKEANDWLEEHGDEEEEEDNESAEEDIDDDDNDSDKQGKKYGAKRSTKAGSKKRTASAKTSRRASSTKRARASEHESDDAKEADELVDGLEDRHKAGSASDASKTGDKEKATAATDAGAAADADADADADKDAHSGKEHDASEELDPATRKVREWRHRLQRAFLSKGGVIVARDMDAQDATFKTVEAYTDMTVDQLKSTKIGKVMKRIQQLADIPRDDEFHFRERAGELMKKWSALLDTQTEEDKQH